MMIYMLMEEHVHGVQRMCIHGARLRNPDNHLLLSLAIHVMRNAGDRGVGKKKLTTNQRNQVNANGMTVHFWLIHVIGISKEVSFF